MSNKLIYIKIRKRIEEDVMRIEEMINACVAVRGERKCPLYQDVIDTQIYGLSKEDFIRAIAIIRHEVNYELSKG